MESFELIEKINLRSIKLSLNSNKILDDINLEIKNDGIHCVLGPNGSGKTMTNKILALLIDADDGSIMWNNKELHILKEKSKIMLRREIGFMNQKPIFLNRSVKSNLELPLTIRDLNKSTRNKIIKAKLSEFGLLDLQDKHPHKVSFGQQQKISLLRSLICDPQILILDEPTASLDLINTRWFEEFMTNYVEKEKKIVLWTSHDQFQVKRIATTISVIMKGKVLENGTQSIFENPKNTAVKAFFEGKLIFQ